MYGESKEQQLCWEIGVLCGPSTSWCQCEIIEMAIKKRRVLTADLKVRIDTGALN